MSQVIILYGTLTGNTQVLAEYLAEELKKNSSNRHITCQNVAEISVDFFANLASTDLILFGSSTWDDGAYPIDTRNFITELKKSPPKLNKIPFATFGCGDSSYGIYYCLAVDNLEQLLTNWGGLKIADGLKIDGYPEMTDAKLATNIWLEKIASWLKQN